jgi:predicted  nucleic acid-binding Zn-ribbon protein
MVAVEERLMPIRKQIERVESKRIEAARDKVAEALNSEAIVALRKEVNDCVTEYNALITKLVAENEEAVRSKAEYEEVKAKIKALRTSTD